MATVSWFERIDSLQKPEVWWHKWLLVGISGLVCPAPWGMLTSYPFTVQNVVWTGDLDRWLLEAACSDTGSGDVIAWSRAKTCSRHRHFNGLDCRSRNWIVKGFLAECCQSFGSTLIPSRLKLLIVLGYQYWSTIQKLPSHSFSGVTPFALDLGKIVLIHSWELK